MPFRPIARKSLSEQVFDQLSVEIVGGRMEVGTSLPAERELAELLGVNRGAVREALKRLEQAGLIHTRHGGGTRVLDFRRTAGLDLLGSMLFHRDGTVDLLVARSLMEMRGVLAPEIAKACALRGGSAVADVLDTLVVEMDATVDLERLQIFALRFWDEIVRGSRNIAYQLSFNTLRQTYEQIRKALAPAMEDELRHVAGYRSIADAVRAKNEQAAHRAATDLIAHGTRGVLRVVEALTPKGHTP